MQARALGERIAFGARGVGRLLYLLRPLCRYNGFTASNKAIGTVHDTFLRERPGAFAPGRFSFAGYGSLLATSSNTITASNNAIAESIFHLLSIYAELDHPASNHRHQDGGDRGSAAAAVCHRLRRTSVLFGRQQ